MTENKKDIYEAYEKFDVLRELLEFENVKGSKDKHLKALDEALDALNRYLTSLKK